MIPFAVRAVLSSPTSTTGPIMLDALVLFGMMSRAGAEAGEWLDSSGAVDLALPFARIRGEGTHWWYAASAAHPAGAEVQRHRHRRAPTGFYERYTDRKSVDMATGADKSQRVPYYIRPAWLQPEWVAIGDPAAVAEALYRVPFIGKFGTHGLGWVRAWQISTGAEIHPLQHRTTCDPWQVPKLEPDDFRDVRMRHQPSGDALLPRGIQVRMHALPLRPPYHVGHDGDAGRLVPCWQAWG